MACVRYAARGFFFGGWIVPKVAGSIPRGLQRYQPTHNGPNPTKRRYAHFERLRFNERRSASMWVRLRNFAAFKGNFSRSLYQQQLQKPEIGGMIQQNETQTPNAWARLQTTEDDLPPVLERVQGLPPRHLVRMLGQWQVVRENGTASQRLRALQQMRRLVTALDNALY